jgi:hypothetical protein
MTKLEQSFKKLYKEYKPGDPLSKDQYIIKFEDTRDSLAAPMAFMKKLNKDKSIGVAFTNWGLTRFSKDNYDPNIYVFIESFRSGWEFVGYRVGESQSWVTVKHPLGFKIEIYLSNFMQLMKTNNIYNGALDGSFKWELNKLIKDDEIN